MLTKSYTIPVSAVTPSPREEGATACHCSGFGCEACDWGASFDGPDPLAGCKPFVPTPPLRLVGADEEEPEETVSAICSNCGGTGSRWGRSRCSECGGRGEVRVSIDEYHDAIGWDGDE